MSTCNVSGNSSKYFLRGYSVIQGCTKGLLLQGQLQVCERVTFSKELFVSNVVFYMGIRVWTSGQSLPCKTSPRGLNMTLHVLSELAIQLEQSVIPYTDALLALTLKNFCIKEATVDNFCKCKHKPLFSQKMYQLKVFLFSLIRSYHLVVQNTYLPHPSLEQ